MAQRSNCAAELVPVGASYVYIFAGLYWLRSLAAKLSEMFEMTKWEVFSSSIKLDPTSSLTINYSDNSGRQVNKKGKQIGDFLFVSSFGCLRACQENAFFELPSLEIWELEGSSLCVWPRIRVF